MQKYIFFLCLFLIQNFLFAQSDIQLIMNQTKFGRDKSEDLAFSVRPTVEAVQSVFNQLVKDNVNSG